MLRHKPTFRYSGLTLILGQMSRFDRTELLTGVAGHWFNKSCLEPETSRYNCDIRLVDDKSPLLDGTKAILLLGQKALSQYLTHTGSLDEFRGSPILKDGIYCIPSFTPQDCCDMRNYEEQFHTHEEDEESDDESEELAKDKGRGRTSRENYRFWLKADIKKALRIIANNGKLPQLYSRAPSFKLCPSIDEVCSYLEHVKNDFFFFDCETDFISLDVRCFSFCFASNPYDVYCVPFLNPDYSLFYGPNTYRLWRALLVAIRDNTIVAHNGAHFDFFVLAHKLGIPVNKVYDTMLAQQRIFPTIEKSLGHCVSLHTYEPYHKNEGVHGFRNWDQVLQLMNYCGKDTFTMWLVKKAQDEMASKDKGLADSIAQANDAIVPYLTTSLAGMHYNEEQRQKLIGDDDKLMNFFMKVMIELCGPSVEPLISNKKSVKYFHDLMGYPVVGYTKANKPSLAADLLLKLAQKHDNPVLKLLVKYRELKHEIGILNFKPWKT